MRELNYPVNIIRTNRRKTVRIYVSRNFVKLYVPKEISENKINDILHSKKSWIISKIKERSLLPPKVPKRYISGQLFPYLGRNYSLNLRFGRENVVKLKRGHFNIFVLENKENCDQVVKKLLFEWYLRKAKKLLIKKTIMLSEEMGVKPKTIVIKDYKSKWGSCSIKGDLCYNWRIVMAPMQVVHYLVAHELCHLLEHNHSQRFWQQLSFFCSHIKESRIWLNKFGNNLIDL